MHRTLRAGVAAVALTPDLRRQRGGSPVRQPHAQQGHQRQRRRDAPALPRRSRLRDHRRRRVRPRHRAQRARLRAGRAAHASTARRRARTSARADARRAKAIPSRPSEETEEAYVDDSGLAVAPASAPEEVQEIIAAGNKIATKPYRYGGGHGRWRDSGYDCSGSISYALHGAGLLASPLDSTGFMSWGERGKGEWVSIYANAGHAYMTVAGLRFDTSSSKRSGSRWSETTRSARGYRVRHPEGL